MNDMLHSFLKISGRFALQGVLAVFLFPSVVPAQGTNIPTRGTRFWTGYMQNGFGANSLKVHIASGNTTSGTVSIPLSGWSAPFSVAANGVTVIDVPTSAENTGSETAANKGVLILSNDTVNVFISSFQNFTHDLSQILPVSSLGNSYRVDSYHGIPNFNNLHKSECLVVATEDGTQIQITPSVNTLGGRPAGIPFSVSLNAGQTFQLQAATDVLDLTGTIIEATSASGSCRPFAVLGGSMCATVPGACQACDAIFEQLYPRNTWGTRYFTVPVSGVNSSTYRILADAHATTVTIGGGAPIVLNAGQQHEVNGTNVPVCIQADKPISVTQFLEGIGCAGNGDPSMVVLSPATRQSTHASFRTLSSTQLNQHSIGVVVPSASVGQLAVDGVVVSASSFQPYAACSDRMHAKIPVSAGVHHVTAANGFQLYMFGLGSGESYAASVNDIQATPVQQDSIVCGGGPITLNAPEALTNAEWRSASTPAIVLATGNSFSFTPAASGSYTVTGLQQITGCPRSFTYHVGIPLTIPTLLTANDGPSAAICQYESVQLALVPPPDPAWFQIHWSPAVSLNDATIAAPIATPIQNTWYTVSVTSPSGCGDMLDSVFVAVAPAAVLQLSTSIADAQLCLGDSTMLNSTALRVIGHDALDAAPSAIWTAVQGGSVGGQCGSLSGNALYFNGNGLRYAQTVGFNTTGGGRVRFHLKIANGASPCDDADVGEDVVLEYSLNNGMNWSLMATYVENLFPTFLPVTANIPASAQTSNTMFRIRQPFHSGAGQDNWAIDQVIIARVDNGWLTYSWSPNSVNDPSAPTTMAHPALSGWYELNGTDPTAGCVYTDSVYVHVDPAFSLSLTNDTTLCAVAGIQLHATPSSGTGITYDWTPNNGTLSAVNIAAPIATPTSTTTYTVNAITAAGCSAQEHVTITVGQLLGLTVSAASDTLCQGQQTQLTAAASGGSGLTYAWTGAGLNNPNIANPVASPAQTTTYTCTVTHADSQCSLTESITVVVNTGYTANAGPDITVCSALGHQLGVQHNVPDPSYSWTPAGNLNSSVIAAPTILADATATYNVTVTDMNGCSVSDIITITRAFANLPVQSSASTCVNVPPMLNAPATGVNYQWNTPSGAGPSGPGATTMTPNQSGPHTVTITDSQGCQGVSTINVTLHAMPTVDLGADVALCGASTHTLDAGNPGSSFVWTPSGTGQTRNVTTSGTYSVTVTNSNQCSASDVVNVQFNTLPVDLLHDVSTCVTTPPTLNAGNTGSSFVWSTNATTQSILAVTSGTYTITITTPQQCSATYSAHVTLVPVLAVDLGNDTTICSGAALTLDAGNANDGHVWSTGATTQTIVVSSTGIYSVTVNNSACTAMDEISVTVIDVPSDQLTDVTACMGQAITLDAGNSGSAYQWNTNTTSRTISPTTSGNYSVTVTNASGCAATFSADVQFIDPPTVQLGNDTTLCDGEVLVLNAMNAGSSVLWNNGATTRTLNVRNPGTYSVEVNNGYCQRHDTIEVRFNPSPARMAARQFHVCLEEEPRYVVLDAGNAGARYAWSTEESSQVILAGAYGWYIVNVTNTFDCTMQDSVVVNEYCPSAIYVPNTFTPNGDGLNDVFIPIGKNISSMHLIVFDRWGGSLFESDDPNVGWDGTFRGEVVKNDMYIWRMTYQFTDKDGVLGREQEQMGHIQVLR